MHVGAKHLVALSLTVLLTGCAGARTIAGNPSTGTTNSGPVSDADGYYAGPPCGLLTPAEFSEVLGPRIGSPRSFDPASEPPGIQGATCIALDGAGSFEMLSILTYPSIAAEQQAFRDTASSRGAVSTIALPVGLAPLQGAWGGTFTTDQTVEAFLGSGQHALILVADIAYHADPTVHLDQAAFVHAVQVAARRWK